MPSGVADGFLRILRHDDRVHARRLTVMSLLVVALAAPAWFMSPDWGLMAHGAGALLGAAIGLLFAGGRAGAYSASLRGMWRQYQKLAEGSQTFHELFRKVRGRPGQDSVYIAAAGLTVAWAAELGMVALAFATDLGPWVPVPVIALNGIVAGALLAHHARMLGWLRAFGRSVQEMLAAGEIGRWGSI